MPEKMREDMRMNRLLFSSFMGKEEGYKANEAENDKAKIITTEEYFNIICKILTEKGLLPDVVKCFFAADNPVPMTTFNFRIANDLYYDGSIYLQLWYKCISNDGTKKMIEFGTFWSLRQDREAMQMMGKLLADILIESERYVNEHLDDFAWEGTDVYAIDQDGNKLHYYHMVSSMEQVLQIKDELLKKYSTVIVRDNITRKKTIYKKYGDDVKIVD